MFGKLFDSRGLGFFENFTLLLSTLWFPPRNTLRQSSIRTCRKWQNSAMATFSCDGKPVNIDKIVRQMVKESRPRSANSSKSGSGRRHTDIVREGITTVSRATYFSNVFLKSYKYPDRENCRYLQETVVLVQSEIMPLFHGMGESTHRTSSILTVFNLKSQGFIEIFSDFFCVDLEWLETG